MTSSKEGASENRVARIESQVGALTEQAAAPGFASIQGLFTTARVK
jgi:hypothetical protein